MLEGLIELGKNPYVWVAVVLISMFFYRTWRSIFGTSVKKKQLLWIGLIGLFLAFGGATMLGVGSVGVSAGGIHISQVQQTTAFNIDNDVADVTDSSTDTTRFMSFYINETEAANDPNIDDGIFLVTRDGSKGLPPASCEVVVHKPPRYDISDITYHLLVEDSTSPYTMDAYVHTATTSGVAGTTDPRERNQLAFAEGVATGYVAFEIQLDETGIDPLTQYDVKTIDISICDYSYTIYVTKGDA